MDGAFGHKDVRPWMVIGFPCQRLITVRQVSLDFGACHLANWGLKSGQIWLTWAWSALCRWWSLMIWQDLDDLAS